MQTEPRNLGKYQLVECIARGGMGTVWKALDTQLKRYVAIKVLHSGGQSVPDFAQRFEREARLIASLYHPNIVKIHNFHIANPPEADPPLFYMVMDYVKGQTLGDYIRQTSHQALYPAPTDLLYILTAISLALDYAHQQGMIHRDIKPANILLDQRTSTERPMGEPILTDFGIARQQGVVTSTLTGVVLGTPLYMSPEQAQGVYNDYRSDLYSLGIIVYEMMTGRPPFFSGTALSIVMQHIQETPIPPIKLNPSMSPALSDVILQSIAKDPDERFPSAAALTIAIAEALQMPTPEPWRRQDVQKSSSESLVRTYISSAPYSASSGEIPQLVDVRRQSNPITPLTGLTEQRRQPVSNPGVQAYQAPVYTPPVVIPTPIAPHPSAPAKTQQPGRRKLWQIMLAALLTLVLFASSIGVYLLFNQQRDQNDNGVISGSITFSKQGATANTAATYNALQIDVQNMPDPPQGMTYYAWLLPSGEQGGQHWPLQVKQHTVHSPLLMAPDGKSLFVGPGLFLITKEQSNSAFLDVPDTNLNARVYYVRLPVNLSAHFALRSCPTDSQSMTCA